jgi:hypothetical protein
MPKRVKKLIADLIILVISIFLAYLLVQNGTLESFISKVEPVRFLAEFVGGILFTSFLTTPFSIALFYVLSESVHPLQVALVGALGACLGDMLIVAIFRNSFFDDFKTIERTLKLKRVFHFFHHSHFNHLAPFIGMLIIASPFPDELGLMMLGASKLKTVQLFILTYIFNAAGIYFISLGARSF